MNHPPFHDIVFVFLVYNRYFTLRRHVDPVRAKSEPALDTLHGECILLTFYVRFFLLFRTGSCGGFFSLFGGFALSHTSIFAYGFLFLFVSRGFGGSLLSHTSIFAYGFLFLFVSRGFGGSLLSHTSIFAYGFLFLFAFLQVVFVLLTIRCI